MELIGIANRFLALTGAAQEIIDGYAVPLYLAEKIRNVTPWLDISMKDYQWLDECLQKQPATEKVRRHRARLLYEQITLEHCIS